MKIFGWTAVQTQNPKVSVQLRMIPNVPRPRGSSPTVTVPYAVSYVLVVTFAGATETNIAENASKKMVTRSPILEVREVYCSDPYDQC